MTLSGINKERKQHSNNTSGHPGVSYIKSIGKWKASYQRKKIRYQSYFDCKQDAIAWRRLIASEL